MFPKIGLVGQGPMGCALAQNLVDHEFEVKVWEQNADVRAKAGQQLGLKPLATSLADMVTSLPAPRCILLFLPSGQPVDNTLESLKGLLEAGDIISDCGNSHYLETAKRQHMFAGSGIDLLGVGVSGGPAGARSGPAIMAGGDRAAWNKVQPIFEAIAAKSNGTPCCGYFGEAGAGHFVKMVHNGIEYGVMHLLAELYGVLEIVFGLDAEAISSVFARLNTNLTAGYLTEITSHVVGACSPVDGRPLVNTVDDAMEQKGTGRWAVEAALEFGAAIPTISEAVLARNLSSNYALRQESMGARVEGAQRAREFGEGDKNRIASALALALASTYAQGLTLLSAADDTFGKQLDHGDILRTWRHGCILSGEMVASLIEAYDSDRKNALSGGVFPGVVQNGLPALRSLTAEAISGGIPMAGFASALAYVELLNGCVWPGRVIQLQRDYFGAHGLHNKETGDVFHGPWHLGEPS